METITLRGREIKVTPFEMRLVNGQTPEHNLLSNDGHIWELDENTQVRTCSKCFRQECLSGPVNIARWVPIPPIKFSTQDIKALTENKRQQKIIVAKWFESGWARALDASPKNWKSLNYLSIRWCRAAANEIMASAEDIPTRYNFSE